MDYLEGEKVAQNGNERAVRPYAIGGRIEGPSPVTLTDGCPEYILSADEYSRLVDVEIERWNEALRLMADWPVEEP